MQKCSVCGSEISAERLEVIPNTTYCLHCAHKYGPKPRFGFMMPTASKGTASVLVTVDPADEEAMRRAQRAHRRNR